VTKRWILVAALLLLAAPAQAGNWLRFCRTTNPTTGILPGEWACYLPSSNSDDSALLATQLCENMDIRYYPDANGDGTASTAFPTVRSCPGTATTGSTAACWITENLIFDGNPATNTEAIYGVQANSIYEDMPAAGTAADPEIDVHCSLPRS
jgi:hypothetical protein